MPFRVQFSCYTRSFDGNVSYHPMLIALTLENKEYRSSCITDLLLVSRGKTNLEQINERKL